MTRDWCCIAGKGIRLTVQITPNAKKTEVVGLFDGALKLRIHAQPIEGKANEALIRFLADVLSVPRNTVSITHGLASKHKTIEIRPTGLTVDDVKHALLIGTGL